MAQVTSNVLDQYRPKNPLSGGSGFGIQTTTPRTSGSKGLVTPFSSQQKTTGAGQSPAYSPPEQTAPSYSSYTPQAGGATPSVIQPIPEKRSIHSRDNNQVNGLITYPGLVRGIYDASQPTGTQRGLVSDLSRTARGNQEIAQNARTLSEQYGKEIARVGGLGAGAVAGDLSTGTNVVGSGNAAIASQGASARMSALSAAQQAALEGTGQQLTAQGQMAGAFGAALGGANTQQQQQISGLGSAAGYAQPSQNFPFVFNPLTGGYTTPGVNGQGGQGGAQSGLTYNPANDAQTFAQQVINHQIPYADAVRALGYAGSTAEGLLQQAITQGGGNLTELQAQTGVQTAQEEQVQSYTSALQQGQNLQNQLTDLISTFGLNPNDLNAANIAIQKIAQNTSDARYQQLQNYVNDIANTYSQILTPPGGAPTDTSRSIAASMLDATSKGTSIIDVMKSLDAAAHAKIAGVRTITPQSGGGSSSSSGGSGWY